MSPAAAAVAAAGPRRWRWWRRLPRWWRRTSLTISFNKTQGLREQLLSPSSFSPHLCSGSSRRRSEPITLPPAPADPPPSPQSPSTASGCASPRTLLLISRRRPGSRRSARADRLPANSPSPSSLLCTAASSPPPRPPQTPRHSSADDHPPPSANGTSSEGFPAAASSATVLPRPRQHQVRRRILRAAYRQKRLHLPARGIRATCRVRRLHAARQVLRAPPGARSSAPAPPPADSAAIFGIVSLKIRAPLLPPYTSSRGAATPSGRGSAIAKISCRTGTPVTSRIAKVRRRLLKVHRRRTHPLTHQPVRQPRHRIRLIRQRRHPQQHRRHHRRPARIPAHTHHHLRPELRSNPTHRITPSGRSSHRPQPRRQAHILQLPRPHQLQRKPRLRHQLRLKPPRRPHKPHLGPMRIAQLPRNRQRRNHMPAGPPTRNQNPQRALCSLFPTPCTLHSIDLARNIQQHAHARQRNKDRSPARTR